MNHKLGPDKQILKHTRYAPCMSDHRDNVTSGVGHCPPDGPDPNATYTNTVVYALDPYQN